MRTSYREPDYTYGASMLTLRTAIGLTQAELAKFLGVSRRAVGDWEAGNSYPKAPHLKALIALGIEQQAFPVGHEVTEIRALWKASRQKILLDEQWLATLLNKQPSSPLPVQSARSEIAPASTIQAPAEISPAPKVRLDWDDALTVPTFYGREQELGQLTRWVRQERCRVVGVLGMGGIGKSAISVTFMRKLAEDFQVVIFRSLRDAPSCITLLDSCLQVLCPQELSHASATLEQYIGLLLTHLRETRTLIVLDNLESLVRAGDVKGHFRSGYEEYGPLLRRVAETSHQSCLLFTSREKPAELRLLENKHPLVHALRLAPLDVVSCKKLLIEQDLIGTEQEQNRLIQIYGGNPLALKVVAETIIDLFSGEIAPFLASGVVLFGGVNDLLGEQFARLSPLERNVLIWLAIAREPLTIDEMLSMLVSPVPHVKLLEAVDSLHRRSLIERGNHPGSFTLQSVILEYVTERLLAESSHEIQQGHLDQLTQYSLTYAHAKEYVRQTQERLLVSPLLAELESSHQSQTSRAAEVRTSAQQLLSLLDELRQWSDTAQGYGPANLIALLRHLHGHLDELDLSQLSLRGAYLSGITMHNTSLAGAQIHDTVFTEAISATWSVAISQDGSLWAAGGMQGNVRVWSDEGRTLCLYLPAHSNRVTALTFSPNGRLLASGSFDGVVKLWNVEQCLDRRASHSPDVPLLWMDWYNCPEELAFSPDGSLLACAGLGMTVQIWDAKTGTSLQSLAHPAQAFNIVWSPDGRFLVSTCFDGRIRLWERGKVEDEADSAALRFVRSWETSPVGSLAFAPDGTTLASADWDCKVKLWEVASGELLHTFEGKTNRSNHLAWSPDGRTLASCSYEQAIWLWDVEERRLRLILHGHTSDIHDLAFTPDSSRLLSSGVDGTLRVWDVQSGQCVRVMEGYAVALYGLDWSPDGKQLICGATDGSIYLWDAHGETPPKELPGHKWAVSGVAWSSDNKLIASCGLDMAIRLWHTTSLTCIQIFREPDTAFASLAWHPDARLLAVGTFLHGMYVWDMIDDRNLWVMEAGQTAFLSTAWSPDGRLLAGGSDDGSVYLWSSTDGTRQQKLVGHHGNVMSLAWSPDGGLLASGSGDSSNTELFVWDIQSGARVQAMPAHSGMISSVVWSPQDNLLISGDNNGTLYWWNVNTGKVMSMVQAHQGVIRSIKVSPDGQSLASGGDDGAIKLWSLAPRELLRTLRSDRPYERLNITGIRGLTEVQKASLRALGAIDHDSS